MLRESREEVEETRKRSVLESFGISRKAVNSSWRSAPSIVFHSLIFHLHDFPNLAQRIIANCACRACWYAKHSRRYCAIIFDIVKFIEYIGSPRIISRVISRDALFDSGAFDRSTWQTTNRKLGKINEVPFSRRIKCTDVMRNRWGEEIMRGWKSVVILGGDNGAVASVVQHDKMKIAGKNDYL